MKWPSFHRPPRRAAIAAGAAGLVVLGVATAGWFAYSAGQHRAMEAYTVLLTRVEGSRASASSPEARAVAARELEALLARYPSAPAVARAALELGDLRYEARQYPQARAAYEVALGREAGTTIGSLARLSIGYAWEAERNWPRAIQAYRAALTGRRPKDFLYEDTMLALGRVQALGGQPTQAADTYRRLLQELPGTRYADEVKSRLAALPAS